MINLDAPFTEEKIRRLSVGDLVLVSGTIFTGRDAVHKWLFDGNKPPMSIDGGIIYHCGPIVIKDGDDWKVMAAGPTTSIREEPYQANVIERFSLRAIIGKGGMGSSTKNACVKCGCVYLHAVGGAAQVLAERITAVDGVFGIDKFGSPEAIWRFKVDKFPAVVTIDTRGKSLHEQVEGRAKTKFTQLLAEIRAGK